MNAPNRVSQGVELLYRNVLQVDYVQHICYHVRLHMEERTCTWVVGQSIVAAIVQEVEHPSDYGRMVVVQFQESDIYLLQCCFFNFFFFWSKLKTTIVDLL